jgi:ketosteroid isomerase-like protein
MHKQIVGGLALIATLAWPQAPCVAGLLDEVMAVDRAFAAAAADSGAQSAFMDYLAPDGVLFRPTPVNGREWLQIHEEASGRLEWSPAIGAVACDGRVAFTVGPWSYRQGNSYSAGTYLTVWRRTAAAEWVVALDHGIETASGAGQAARPVLEALAGRWSPAGDRGCSRGAGADDLAKADRDANELMRSRGLAAAVQRYAGGQAVLFRDGHAPAVMTADWPAGSDLGTGLEVLAARAVAGEGSDLGYTYGTMVAPGQGGASVQPRAVYVRVWVRKRRDWILAADMMTEVVASPPPNSR